MVISITGTKHRAAITTTTRTQSSRACCSASDRASNVIRAAWVKGMALLAATALIFAGCDRDDQQIKVYRVSKAPLESTPPPSDATMPTNASSPAADSLAAPPTSERPQIKWDVPAEWTSAPASAM